MKVVAFNGSARKDGNTAILVRAAFKELEKAGIKPEFVQLSGKKVHGCTACMKCREKKDRRCVIDDFASECIAKMDEADGSSLRRQHLLGRDCGNEGTDRPVGFCCHG